MKKYAVYSKADIEEAVERHKVSYSVTSPYLEYSRLTPLEQAAFLREQLAFLLHSYARTHDDMNPYRLNMDYLCAAIASLETQYEGLKELPLISDE